MLPRPFGYESYALNNCPIPARWDVNIKSSYANGKLAGLLWRAHSKPKRGSVFEHMRRRKK